MGKLKWKHVGAALLHPAGAAWAFNKTAGKTLRRKWHWQRKNLMPSVHSAGTYSIRSSSPYGATGSIVGRY